MKRLSVVFLVLTMLVGPKSAGSLWAEGDEALQAGVDAYVFAYPLVLMDVTRQYTLEAAGARENEFFQGSLFADTGSGPQDDNLLIWAAWLDLSKEPVIVHMPDFGSRYHLAQIIDGWTNKLATLRPGSPGKGRDFGVVGPRWKGELPPGVTRVASSTDMALILVRIRSSGAIDDIAAVLALQEQMSLLPLSLYGIPGSTPFAPAGPGTIPAKPPSEQVAVMDARAFFTYFARLLASDPPDAADADMMEKLSSMGIVPGPDFDFDKLDPVVRDGISRSVLPAQTKVESPCLPRAASDARLDPDVRAYYQSRAHGALAELAMNASSDLAGAVEKGQEPEETVSVESDILFKPEGGKGGETGFDIREDIERAQEFLRDKIAGYTQVIEAKSVSFPDRKGRSKEKIVERRIIRPNFLLAVEDLKERKIRQVLITGGKSVTEGFRVTRKIDNGVASRFEVTYPANMAILALRTVVRSGDGGLKEAVYTPYSPEIDTWQVRKAGLEYLTERIKVAQSELAAKKIWLARFHGTGDTTPIEVSLVLSIIEHIDPGRFEQCRSNEVALVHEVLTVIGANTTSAYSYSRSPAGARGLFQLLPETYRRLQEKYRSAGLKKDFVSGSNDHTNAAKASLLLLDSDLANLPKKLSSAARKDGRLTGMYLAAAYNCGSGRVEKSARECKNHWTCRLPEETRVYLKKFEAVWNLRHILDK